MSERAAPRQKEGGGGHTGVTGGLSVQATLYYAGIMQKAGVGVGRWGGGGGGTIEFYFLIFTSHTQ